MVYAALIGTSDGSRIVYILLISGSNNDLVTQVSMLGAWRLPDFVSVLLTKHGVSDHQFVYGTFRDRGCCVSDGKV